MHKEFIIDLENQMEECHMENEVLEMILKRLERKKHLAHNYMLALSQQKLKHNNETIDLLNKILKDIYGNNGVS